MGKKKKKDNTPTAHTSEPQQSVFPPPSSFGLGKHCFLHGLCHAIKFIFESFIQTEVLFSVKRCGRSILNFSFSSICT